MQPTQDDFVRNYAAKRAAQMDRARALREQRQGQQAQQRPPSQSEYQQPPAHQHQQQQHQQPSYQHHQQQPPASQRQSEISQQWDAPPPRETRAAPVSRTAATSRAPQAVAGGRGSSQLSDPPPAHRATMRPRDVAPEPTEAYVEPAARPSRQQQPQRPSAGGGSDHVTVTESDFRRAVSLGVISSDQARQLWTVVSSGGSGGMSYDSGNYAPSSAPAQPQDMTDLRRAPRNSASAGQKGPRGKPEWNAAPLSYDDPPMEEEEEQPIRPPPQRGGAASRVKQPQIRENPEWNMDVDDGEGGFGAPPPIKGRRSNAPAKASANKPQRGQPQHGYDDDEGEDAYDAPPARSTASRAPRSNTSNTVQSGRRSGQPRSPPPREEVRHGDGEYDEVAEMERQKQEAKERFEMEALQAEEAAGTEAMAECSICGRSFRESIIARHEKACKVSNKKRKAFDVKAQRLDIDGAEVLKQAERAQKRQPTKQAAAAAAAAPKKIPKWKMQHEQFQAAIAAGRAYNQAQESGGVMAPPPPVPAEFDDRVPCPHCNRKFASEVAERHIPKCRTMVNRPKPVGVRR